MLAQSSSSQFSSVQVKVALPLTTSCALTWDDRKLFVRVASPEESLDLEALQDSDRLVECLRRSPVELVKLDSNLSPELLLRWAEACSQAKKACYLTTNQLNSNENSNQFKRRMPFVFRVLSQTLGVWSLMILSPFAVLNIGWLAVKGYSVQLRRGWGYDQRGRILAILDLQIVGSEFDFIPEVSPLLIKAVNALNIIRGEVNVFIEVPQMLEFALSLE